MSRELLLGIVLVAIVLVTSEVSAHMKIITSINLCREEIHTSQGLKQTNKVFDVVNAIMERIMWNLRTT